MSFEPERPTLIVLQLPTQGRCVGSLSRYVGSCSPLCVDLGLRIGERGREVRRRLPLSHVQSAFDLHCQDGPTPAVFVCLPGIPQALGLVLQLEQEYLVVPHCRPATSGGGHGLVNSVTACDEIAEAGRYATKKAFNRRIFTAEKPPIPGNALCKSAASRSTTR